MRSILRSARTSAHEPKKAAGRTSPRLAAAPSFRIEPRRRRNRRGVARFGRPMRMAMAALALAACGGSGAAGATTCPIPAAPAAPTFSGDLLPALQPSCGALSGTCHGGAAPTGHFSFATGAGRAAAAVRADLVNVAPATAPSGWLRVAPFDPGRSWILEKIAQDQPGGLGYGARMPMGGADVCAATAQAIRAWIERGAPND